jgi:hypothetical protein
MQTTATRTDKRRLAAILVCAVLLLGIAFTLMSMRRAAAPVAGARAFFSVDDGKTWFADDATKLPPFDKAGKQAVRAYVYRSGNGTEFVNYLERFKPEARRALEDASRPDPNPKVPPNQAAIQSAYIGGREVKRPGDANWIATANSRDAAQVQAVKSPDGSTDAVPVEP